MSENPVFLLYASHDGQTGRIALRLMDELRARGQKALPCNLAKAIPPVFLFEEAAAIVLLSPIRYGYHLRPIEEFIQEHKALLQKQILGMVSINLTARKAGKDQPETNAYFKKWIKKHQINPDISAVIAGRLDYPRYSWLDRQMIRFIMKITGGPTDPQTQVEYTQWDRLGVLADHIVARIEERMAA